MQIKILHNSYLLQPYKLKFRPKPILDTSLCQIKGCIYLFNLSPAFHPGVQIGYLSSQFTTQQSCEIDWADRKWLIQNHPVNFLGWEWTWAWFPKCQSNFLISTPHQLSHIYICLICLTHTVRSHTQKVYTRIKKVISNRLRLIS